MENKEEDDEIEVTRCMSERTSTQKRAFTKWVNQELQKVNEGPLDCDLVESFKTGERLEQLHRSLTGGERVKINISAHESIRRAEVDKMLNKFKEDKILKTQLETTAATNLISGDFKVVMAFIWQLIDRYDGSTEVTILPVFSTD